MFRNLPNYPATRLAAILLGSLFICAGAASAGSHGYLGVTLQDINSSMAKALQLDEGVGVLVLEVVEDSPADEAGLAEGDVILAFDGDDIDEDNSLTRAVRRTDPGQTVAIEILRDGKRRTIEVELGEYKSSRSSFAWSSRDGDSPGIHFYGDGDGDSQVFVFPDGDDENVWFGHGDAMKKLHLESLGIAAQRGYMGVEFGGMSKQLGEHFGVEGGEGALINAVNEDTPAEAAGLRAGDVIVAIGDEPVERPGDVHAALSDFEPGDEIEITYVRKGDRRTVELTLAEMPEGAFAFSVGKLPRFERHIAPDIDIAFPEGFKHDVRVVAPKHPRSVRVITDDDEEDLDELRDELERMKKELKELKKDLKK